MEKMDGNAIITGASSGIGKSLAYFFAEKGMSLWLVSRNEAKLAAICDDLTKKYDIQATYSALDLSEKEGVATLESQIKAQNTPLRMVINNAGFGLAGAFDKSKPKEVEEMLFLNMMALTSISRAAIDKMKQNKVENQAIINIASVAGLAPTVNMAAYGATKAYVVSFSRALGVECKGHDIQVLTVCPGPVKTEFAKVAGIKSPMFDKIAQTPEEVTQAIWKAYQNKKSFLIPGWSNRLMTRLSKLLPFSVTASVGAKLLK